MLIGSGLDPPFCRLKFLPSKERADVYSQLARIANECSHSKKEEEQVPIAKKSKVDSLLNYHDPSSDLSGSSPTDVCDQVEREISQYKSEEEIDNTADPLFRWNYRFHALFVLAKKFLCITAMTVPSERLFSKARTIVDRRHCALDPLMLIACHFHMPICKLFMVSIKWAELTYTYADFNRLSIDLELLIIDFRI